MKKCLFLLLPLLLRQAFAQTGYNAFSPLHDLQAFSAHHADVPSMIASPPALARLKSPGAGLTGERRFLLSELSVYRAAVGLPLARGGALVGLGFSGTAFWGEKTLSLAYGRSLGERLEAGAGFQYATRSGGGYPAIQRLQAAAGLTITLMPSLRAGLQCFLPAAISEKSARGPVLLSAALGYDLSPQLYIGAVLRKSEDRPASLAAGVLYYFDERLFAAAGLDASLPSFSFGGGVAVADLLLRLTVSSHPYLGLTPALAILYSKKRRHE